MFLLSDWVASEARTITANDDALHDAKCDSGRMPMAIIYFADILAVPGY
jgi:hypothetical protein